MQTTNTHPFTSFRLRLLAVSEWLLVLPATVFLAAAALRLVQPRQYQPARLSWAVFEWAMRHISGMSAAVLLIALPAMVFIIGGLALWMIWRHDQALRQDTVTVLAIVRRRLAIGLLITATLLGGGILLVAMVHMITD